MSSIGNNADLRAIKDYFDRTEPNNNEANSVRESFYRWFETKAWALRVRGIHVQDQVVAKAKRYRDRFNALNADPSLAGPIGDSPMLNATLKRLDFQLDRATDAIVFSGETQEGQSFRVSFPIAHVSAVFDQEATAMGYTSILMGEYGATLDGFERQVYHARRRGYGGAYDRTMNRVRRHAAHYGLHGARYVNGYYGTGDNDNDYDDPELGSLWSSFKKFTLAPITLPVKAAEAVARSKAAGTVLGGVAIAFPAVGAPALAAWGAAHTAMAMYDAHQKGHPTNFPQLHANITRISQEDTITGHTTMAALASTHVDIHEVIRQAEAFLNAARGYEAQGQVNVNMGAPYIAPPTGHAIARVAPPAATSARTYVAAPTATRAYVAPPTATRAYVAPPVATRAYIAPPTGRSYIAPQLPAWNTYRRALPFGASYQRNYVAPASYVAPLRQWDWRGYDRAAQPAATVNQWGWGNYERPAPPAPVQTAQQTWDNRPLAPPPAGYYRDASGNLRPIASTTAEPFDPAMPYGRRHHRRHEFQHEQPAQTFHQGYYS